MSGSFALLLHSARCDRDIHERPAWIRSRYAFIPVIVALLISAGVNLQLFQDGSSYLFELLGTHSAVRHHRLSVLLIQAPTIVAGKLLSALQSDPTVRLQMLRFLFSASYALIPLVSLALCWLILRKNHRQLFVWPVLMLLLINLVNFSWVSELLIALHFCFPLFLASIVIPGTRLYWLLTGTLLPTVFFLHPLVTLPFLGIATGSVCVGAMRTDISKGAKLNAVLYFIAAISRMILGLNTFNAYESGFLEPIKMGRYLFGASIESELFLANSVATGLACVLAKSSIQLRRSSPVLIAVFILAQCLAIIMILRNLGFLSRFAELSILLAGFALALSLWRCCFRQRNLYRSSKLLYKCCMSSAALSGLLLVSQYFAVTGQFRLKTGLTVFAFLLMLPIVFVDSLSKISIFECAQRWKLVIVLCMMFAVVTITKSLVWRSSVQKLEQALAGARMPCAEIPAPEYGWLQRTPYSIINNWALPTLAVVVQDTPPRRLLLTENGCRLFYDSGLVPIDPWSTIPKTRIVPPLS